MQSNDAWNRRPPPPRRDRLRTWLTIGAPVLVLVAVVAFGVFGRSIEPRATPSPALVAAAASVAASSAPSAPTAAPQPTPQASQPVAAACTESEIPFDATAPIDLTGTWAGDDDGVYFVRQLDEVVWWNGMSSRDGPPGDLGRDWNNVGRGILGEDGRIVADWSDVPRGGAGGQGTVTLQVQGDATGNLEVVKVEETGSGRGDRRWTPCTIGFIR